MQRPSEQILLLLSLQPRLEGAETQHKFDPTHGFSLQDVIIETFPQGISDLNRPDLGARLVVEILIKAEQVDGCEPFLIRRPGGARCTTCAAVGGVCCAGTGLSRSFCRKFAADKLPEERLSSDSPRRTSTVERLCSMPS
jgi:hypothetical protein